MASSIYDKKQKFEKIKDNQEAIEYHAKNFTEGQIYTLAKNCYAYLQLKNSRTAYQVYLDSLENKEI
jgi:hypothetical protein